MVCLAGYTRTVHKHLLMGRALGGGSRAGAFSYLVTRIVPDNSEITALICCIDVVLIDSCSIVSHESTKEAQKSEQEAGQRRRIDNEARRRTMDGALHGAHYQRTEAQDRLRQDEGRSVGQARQGDGG